MQPILSPNVLLRSLKMVICACERFYQLNQKHMGGGTAIFFVRLRSANWAWCVGGARQLN